MYQILYLPFVFVSVFAAFQSEPLYVPVKFHDLPSEKPENTNIDTEKSKQNLEFHNLEMDENFSFSFKQFQNLVVLWVAYSMWYWFNL